MHTRNNLHCMKHSMISYFTIKWLLTLTFSRLRAREWRTMRLEHWDVKTADRQTLLWPCCDLRCSRPCEMAHSTQCCYTHDVTTWVNTNRALCPQNVVFLCFVQFSQSKAIVSLNNINWPIFITEVQITVKYKLAFDLYVDCRWAPGQMCIAQSLIMFHYLSWSKMNVACFIPLIFLFCPASNTNWIL
jgi:hypothetical protein